MVELTDAITHYHSLLDTELGQQSQAQLTAQLNQHGLYFGERPLCTVLRPRFLSPGQYAAIRHAIAGVMPAFDKLQRAALADSDLRAKFFLADWEEHLLATNAGFTAPSPTARMDSFFAGDELWFTEYNAETPAAPAYCDLLTEVFQGLPIMRRFEHQYEMRPLPGRHHVLEALLGAYQEWGGREKPRIAILDWHDVPTYSEFVLFEAYFHSQGFECLIVDPRDCEFRDGALLAGGAQVHLIYKRVLISELVERCGVEHDVVRAVRDRAVCMVNPFACKVLHKKASLAMLSDEANRHLFSANEAGAIDQYIPWTRLVAERHTNYQGRTIDLLPFVAEHPTDFVLKPNDEYGGKGIVLGWDVGADEWTNALRLAVTEPYIVQRRVPVPAEPYPSLVDGRVEILDRMLDTNPFVWQGAYASGCLTRLSTAALLNVTAGGGSSVPTFVVERRA